MHLRMLLSFLGLSQGLKSNLRLWRKKLHPHPLGTNFVTSPALCLAELAGPLLGAVFTLSHQ